MISFESFANVSLRPFQTDTEALKYSSRFFLPSSSSSSLLLSPFSMTSEIKLMETLLYCQNLTVFSETLMSASVLSSISLSSASHFAVRIGLSTTESCSSDASSLALRYIKAFGSASSEWSRSMTLLLVAENSMVAGVKAGAGAEEVVWVRDRGERDLSRNSTIDYATRVSRRTREKRHW